MTREEHLAFCRKCTNRKMDLQQGLICQITNEKADFEETCENFNRDEEVKEVVTSEDGQEQPFVVDVPDETLDKLRPHQDFFYACVGSLIISIVCAILWAVITVTTEYQIGYMAIGVGLAVGYATRFFGAGVDQIYGFTGAFFALLGCLLGNLFSQVGFIAQAQQLGYFETLTFFDFATIILIFEETFSPIDLLFYGIAIYEGYRFAFRPVTEEMLESDDLTPPFSKLRLPIVIVSVVLLSISMFALSRGVSGEQVLYYENGEVMSKGNLTEGMPDGPWSYYYENGRLQANANYINGMESGEWEWYQEDGTLIRKGAFKNGLPDGLWLNYDENGALYDSSNYVDGRLHGAHRSYFPNGQLAQEGIFKRDRNEGPWKYYYENGNLRSAGNYESAVPLGLWEYYGENGVQMEVFDHISEDTIKIITSRDETGKMMVTDGNGMYIGKTNGILTDQGMVEDGYRVGEWTTYHANGEMKSKGTHKEGILYTDAMWDNQGTQVVSDGNGDFAFKYEDSNYDEEKGSIKGGLPHGTWTYYYPNSLVIRMELTYENGETNGRSVSYFENGMTMTEGYLVDGEREGEWTWYYDSGVKQTTISYEKGKKEGEQIFWSESGIEAKKEIYKNGELIEEFFL